MKTCCFFLLITLAVPGSVVRSIAQTEPEVSTQRSHYLPNEPITVAVKNGPGNLTDWVGLYVERAPAGSFTLWQYLDGTQASKVPMVAGETIFTKGLPKVGAYEVRYYANDGYDLLAENVFVVTNAPRVLIAQRTLLPGAELRIAFTNTPGQVADHVLIQAPGDGPGTFVSKVYLDGTATGEAGKTNGVLLLTAPSTSGSYVARLFLAGSAEPVDEAAFTTAYPAPVVSATYDASSVTLRWSAPTWPVTIERYEVEARPAGATAFEKIGEVAGGGTALTFQHPGLAPGSERGYRVRTVGSAGNAASISAVVTAAAVQLEPGVIVAYGVAPSTPGNQAWPGALGMEFEVVNAITVSQLGVFDAGGDGLQRPLTARLWDRTLRKELGRLDFTATSPGILVGGSRFKALAAPIDLPSGFKGVITAEGYGSDEPAGNAGLGALPVTTADGNGSVLFVGRGRFGRAGIYPLTVDGGPANRYAAGSFQYQVREVRAPGKPALTTIPDNQSVRLSWAPVTQPVPAVKYRISRASGPTSTFTQIAEITATEYVDSGLTNGRDSCYKVAAVTADGVVGPDSDTSCQAPDVVQGGIAYVNPAELEGNQEFGGAVGNDFDVTRPIQVTRLGAFDDASDGLKRTITVRLYDRVSQQELAKLVFTPAEPGELIQGSRFKDLVPPVNLAPGFQGVIAASGYGENERDGNEGIPGTADLNLEMFSGGCLRFVGSSRWGDDPDAFPGIRDGGPENRYAAGTFRFEPLSLDPQPVLTIRAASATTVIIEWTGGGVLERVAAIPGTWQVVEGAVSGVTIPIGAATQFYRVRR